MSRAALLLVALSIAGCGADPEPPVTTSAADEPVSQQTAAPPTTATAVATSSGSAAVNHLPHEAKDPASLLGGGEALDALPTRASVPGKPIDPALRQRLMEPPP